MSQHKYNIYPTLLDAFQSYLDCEVTYEKYWGGTDEPKKTAEEYEDECFMGLIEKINRVPIDSEAADRGTTFNEIIDCLIANKKSEKVEMQSDREIGTVKALYNGRSFVFPLSVCLEFSRYFKGAVSQVYCDAILPTKYGDVYLYGYIDELLIDKVHDIKTTSNYEAWKYRKNWQHRVYPFCLDQQGNKISAFEYNILEIKGDKHKIYKEYYNYDRERTEGELTAICEQFIEFIEQNKKLITDTKIFNQKNTL